MSDSSQLAKGCWRKKAGKYFLQCILVIDLVAAADDHGDWQPDKTPNCKAAACEHFHLVQLGRTVEKKQ